MFTFPEYFAIDQMTGSISTNRTLVARSLPYILNVSAISNGQPIRTTYTNVQIYVLKYAIPEMIFFYVPEADYMHYYAYEVTVSTATAVKPCGLHSYPNMNRIIYLTIRHWEFRIYLAHVNDTMSFYVPEADNI